MVGPKKVKEGKIKVTIRGKSTATSDIQTTESQTHFKFVVRNFYIY